MNTDCRFLLHINDAVVAVCQREKYSPWIIAPPFTLLLFNFYTNAVQHAYIRAALAIDKTGVEIAVPVTQC